MKEDEQPQITRTIQAARSYGKTSFELGYEQGQRKLLSVLLAARFGTLSEEVNKRLKACSSPQLLELATKMLTARSLRDLGLTNSAQEHSHHYKRRRLRRIFALASR